MNEYRFGPLDKPADVNRRLMEIIGARNTYRDIKALSVNTGPRWKHYRKSKFPTLILIPNADPVVVGTDGFANLMLNPIELSREHDVVLVY
ncbi:MAG: hypothetical protein ABIG30_03035 [Candidatus Aenigmatarchaeota archaeon]